jgi:4-amino-4-deoxy-L-arabinose transferase-like glycosyltransferase
VFLRPPDVRAVIDLAPVQPTGIVDGGTTARLVGFLERRADRVMGAVCLVVALVGIGVAVHQGSTLKFFDERQYLVLGDSLAHHGSFSLTGHGPSAYRPPTWPLMVGVMRLLGAGVVTMRMVDVLLLVVTVFVLYRITTAWTRPVVGIAAGLLVACDPLLIYTSTTLYPQTSAGLLLVVVLWLAGRNGSRPILELALAGVAAGVLVLDVSTFVYLLPFLPLFLRNRATPYATGLVAVVLGAALVVGAWTIRNYVELHHLFFVSTNGGVNLLLGNSPHAGADTGVSADISVYTAHAQHLHGEVAQNSYYQRQALLWIRQHPGTAVHLYVLKFLNFFNSSNTLATAGAGSSAQGLVLTAYQVLLVAMLVARLVLWRRITWRWLTTWTVAMYLIGALFSAVFFTRVRFRGPYDILLTIAIAPLAAIAVRRDLSPEDLRDGTDSCDQRRGSEDPALAAPGADDVA